MSVAPPQPATNTGYAPMEKLLDDHLRALLADLRILVPYDVAAAWLGHDDRPLLRVSVPEAATLPSIESARHRVFGATAGAARIGDLEEMTQDVSGLRAWLGVPLVLHDRRRGWIELWSERPHRFTEGDVRRAEVLVRQASIALTQLEASAHLRHEAHVHRRLTASVEAALCAPSLRATFESLLEHIAEIDEDIAAASLIVPLETAYALGLESSSDEQAEQIEPLDATRLVSVVARWTRPSPESSDRAGESLPGHATMLVPLTHEDAAVGWVELQGRMSHLPGAIEPALLQPVTALLGALLLWLQAQAQREQHAQQSVRMLVQQAYQARSAAISDLVAGLAHEINNPVSAITGMVALLRRDSTLPESVHADLKAIADEARRISNLVTRLAGFGAPDGSSRESLDLNEIVADAVAVLHGLARERGIALRVALPPESPVVHGNRAQLQQACLDLVANALDAVDSAEAPDVVVEVATADAWALVRVADNGCGIPDTLHDRVFAPGFTTKSAGGTRRGLGMGLPMALDIARSHRGTITVESAIWSGSTFTLRLPLI